MSFNPKQKPVILLPNMGEGDMPDNRVVKDALEAMGMEVITADLSYNGTIRELPWERIDVVDLRNMRGSLTNFEKYMGIVDRVYDKIHTEKKRDHSIKTVPGYNEICWIASKSNYLAYLQDAGIETIPTRIIRRHSRSTRPSIVEPDNVDNAINEAMSYMQQSDKSSFVLKPSVSSLAKRLYFIEKNQDDSYTVKYPKEDKTVDAYHYQTEEQFRSFMRQYVITTPSPDEAFLLQEYVDNLETSAVFIGGTPHYIERTYAEAKIAHGKYGGTDTVKTDLDPALLAFVTKVQAVLPENVKQSPFYRIDVMWDAKNEKYILSEIEGAGAARLWLQDANRVADYAKMLIGYAERKHKLEYAPKENVPEARYA